MQRNAAPWRKLPATLTSWAAGLYLLFALAIVSTWIYPPWGQYVPHWLRKLLYPIDKTELDLLRLLHFLAQAYLVVRLVSPQAAFLSSRIARPVLLCGKHSLDVFCASIFLSFAAQFVLVEVSPSLPAQVLVSLAGMGIMVALAYLLTWYTDTEKAGSAPRGGKTRVPVGGD